MNSNRIGQPPTSNFNHIARPYRWLEYLTLGRSLERCRLHFLPQLSSRSQALVLGDGDGRFLAALLARNSTLAADAVDTSATMLSLLRSRCERTSVDIQSRLNTHHTDALSFLAWASPKPYDLVVTHFFLDCLTQSELEALAASISAKLAPGAIWLISDFRIPAAGIMHYPAKLLVDSLYLAFRILTGLRTQRLPDHAAALAPFFTRISDHQSLRGILTTELWTTLPSNPESVPRNIPKMIMDPAAPQS